MCWTTNDWNMFQVNQKAFSLVSSLVLVRVQLAFEHDQVFSKDREQRTRLILISLFPHPTFTLSIHRWMFLWAPWESLSWWASLWITPALVDRALSSTSGTLSLIVLKVSESEKPQCRHSLWPCTIQWVFFFIYYLHLTRYVHFVRELQIIQKVTDTRCICCDLRWWQKDVFRDIMAVCLELQSVVAVCPQLLTDSWWSQKVVLERRSRGPRVYRYCLPQQNSE